MTFTRLACAIAAVLAFTAQIQAATFTAEAVDGRVFDINQKGEYIYRLPAGGYALYLPATAYGLPAGSTTLLALDGSNSVNAVALNDSGVVVGESRVDSGPWHLTIWTNGAPADINPLSTAATLATGINNLGHLTVSNNSNALWDVSAFFYDGAQFHNLEPTGTGPCLFSRVYIYDINNSDAIIGLWICNLDTFTFVADYYLWQGTSATKFTHPDFEYPGKINNNGQLLGRSSMPPYFLRAIYDGGTVTVMPQFKDSALELNYGPMNDFGHAVAEGYLFEGEEEYRAFMWLPNDAYGLEAGVYDINDLVDLPTHNLVDATAINNSGQIALIGIDNSTFSEDYFLLTPVKGPLVVNSTGDQPDADTTDGVCLTTSGDCTFRAAIMEANARPGMDTISFNIPKEGIPRIYPDSVLPEITDAVIIDGSTQPSADYVILRSDDLVDGFHNGLVIRASHCAVHGLIINGWWNNGISMISADSSIIDGVIIGVGPNGEPRSNLGHGIFIDSSDGILIGYPSDSGLFITPSNTIAHNKGAGVFVKSGEGNTIYGNSIFSNGGLGIDLAPSGATYNDSMDVDSGANRLINYPIIDSVTTDSTTDELKSVSIWGSLMASPSTQYIIELFANDECDTSSFGEGQRHLTALSVTTDNTGFAQYVAHTLFFPLNSVQFFSATTTDSDGNTSEFSRCWGRVKKLSLVDFEGNPISKKTVHLSRASYDLPGHDFTYEPIAKIKTDTSGIVDLTNLYGSGVLLTGDTIQILRIVDSLTVDRREPRVYIDNGKFDPYHYELGYDTLTSDTLQAIMLDHSTFVFAFRVEIEWDATRPYIDSLRSGIRQMANYLYDVTDGQVEIHKVYMDENQGRTPWKTPLLTDLPEILIVADNSQYTDSRRSYLRAVMPRRFFQSGNAANQSAAENPTNPAHIDHWRKLAAVLGEHLFGFFPERRLWPLASGCDTKTDLGFMAWPFPQLGDDGANSEMSWSLNYENSDCQGTGQFEIHKQSCWDYFESEFEISSHRFRTSAPVIKPDERELVFGRAYFIGPNDYDPVSGTMNLQNDVGARVVFVGSNLPSAAFDEFWELTDIDGAPLAGVKVVVREYKSLDTLDYVETIQGETSESGHLWLVGVEHGDVVVASGGQFTSIIDSSGALQPVSRWVNGEAIISDPGSLASGLATTHTLILKPIAGDFPLIASAELGSETFDLLMDASRMFDSLPEVIYLKDSIGLASEELTLSSLLYRGTIDFGSSQTGQIAVNALDDSLNLFSFTIRYSLADGVDSLSSNIAISDDASAEFLIDAINAGIARMLVVSSPFPIIRGDLNPLSIQAGQTHALSVYPAIALSGENILVMNYNESDFSGVSGAFNSALGLKIHRWNAGALQWEAIESVVDTATSQVAAQFTQTGVYAAFTTDFTSDIEFGETGGVLPEQYELHQNYPNPFNPNTSIAFSLPAASHVKLEVFNILGQAVATLHNGPLPAGLHRYEWDGTASGSGVYFYRLTAGDYVRSRKMVLLK